MRTRSKKALISAQCPPVPNIPNTFIVEMLNIPNVEDVANVNNNRKRNSVTMRTLVENVDNRKNIENLFLKTHRLFRSATGRVLLRVQLALRVRYTTRERLSVQHSFQRWLRARGVGRRTPSSRRPQLPRSFKIVETNHGFWGICTSWTRWINISNATSRKDLLRLVWNIETTSHEDLWHSVSCKRRNGRPTVTIHPHWCLHRPCTWLLSRAYAQTETKPKAQTQPVFRAQNFGPFLDWTAE